MLKILENILQYINLHCTYGIQIYFESHFLYPYLILGKVPGVAHGVLNIFDKKNSE